MSPGIVIPCRPTAWRQLRWRKTGAKHTIIAAKRGGRRGMTAVLWSGQLNLPAHPLRHLPRTPTPQHRPVKLAKAELKMHALLRTIGVFALIGGLGFIGHGSRFLAYPGERVMIRWVYYGASIAVVGLLLIIFSRPSDEP
jgi:hypothetical protein